MAGFGFNIVDTAGFSISVSADGRPEMKAGGITVDWGTVAVASGADVTLADGVVIHAGDQFLRYGQVVCAITNPANDVLTVTGAPTGGTFTITLATGLGTVTTAAIAYNASAATVAAAINAALATLPNLPADFTPVATVTGSAGGPWSVGLPGQLGATTITTTVTGLTGGSSPNVTVTQNLATGDVGKYGPFDSAASDGRQLLTPGSCWIVEKTVRSDEPKSDYVPVLYGGMVFEQRMIQSGVSAHSLAAGPTRAELLTAFPRLVLVSD